MKKPLAVTLLILLGELVSAGVVLGGLGLFGLIPDKIGFVSFVLFAAHIAAFVFVQKRFNKAYGLSAPKFVLCAAVPPAVTALAVNLVIDILINMEIIGSSGGTGTGVLAISNTDIFLIFWLFYAIGFLAVFSVALGLVSAFKEWWEREQDLG